MTYTQGGVARAWFDFGDVAMQTAGEQRKFTIDAVPEPNRVVKILNELKLEEEHEKIYGESKMTPAEKFFAVADAKLALDVWVLGKGASVIAVLLYIMFALVVMKQIKLMSRAINGLAERGG